MRAARIHGYGDPGVIQVEDAPILTFGDDQVLVEVAGYSFNPGETHLRAGHLQDMFHLEFPYTLGHDVAGRVVDVGPNVSALSRGESVIGRIDEGGAAAEFVAVSAEILTRAPETIPLPDAAAIPVAGLTAWQAVMEHGRVSAGDSVLVNGAGGGVGVFAIQLVKNTGATVIATASSRSRDRVAAPGADEIIDYTAVPVASALTDPIDVLLNLIPVDQSTASGLGPLVRDGGTIVSITERIPVPADAQVRSIRFNARNDPSHLAALVDLVDRGRLFIVPTEHRPLSDLAEVHTMSERGQLSGKVVLIP